jgi:uncharacterized protein DUF4058
MPIHDWTRVDAGLFHAFHHGWIEELARALNHGILPPDYFALPEQNIRGAIPDVLALKLTAGDESAGASAGEVAVAERAPRARLTQRAEAHSYIRKASHVAVRHRHGQVVSIIEVISPGNKASRAEFRALVEKSADLIRQGVHLLLIDLFPAGKRDPHGVHKAIWDEFEENDIDPAAASGLTLASYDAGPDYTAYVEFAAVGERLPDMPLFLKPGIYVLVPLDATYQRAWQEFPVRLRQLLEPGSVPAGGH